MKTANKFGHYAFSLMVATLMLFSSCEKGDKIPALSTTEVTEITETTAVSGGIITDDGGATITARGVCWSTSQDPTISDSKTEDGDGLDPFTSIITYLKPGTNYYVRAYATNSEGTAYGDQVLFRTKRHTGTVTDIDGNEYETVKIGEQWWMAENLKVRRYNDGANIDYPVGNHDWMDRTTGAYNWYDHDYDNYGSVYGALYNWHAIETGNLCPEGWVVPSNAEWIALTWHLGGYDVAGGKLKSTRTEPDPHPRWDSPNQGATNESGFSALPGSMRFYNGDFNYNWPIGSMGSYWTSTKIGDSEFAWSRFILGENTRIDNYSGSRKRSGRSVRCMMYEE